MTNAEFWLTYQLASRAHLGKNASTTQLIELEFQNHKLVDLEDVLDHARRDFDFDFGVDLDFGADDVQVFRQGFVEAKFRPATWWEGKDGQKVKASQSVEELLMQGVGKCPDNALKLVVQDVPAAVWFKYVYPHNASAPAVAQRVKLASPTASTGRLERLAHVTNYVFAQGYLAAKLRPTVHWEDGCGKRIEEHAFVEEVLGWGEGGCEERPLRLIVDAPPLSGHVPAPRCGTPPPVHDAHPGHCHGPVNKNEMPRRQRPYSPFTPPSLSMSELVKTTLDHDSTDMLIDKWLEHRSAGHDAYHDWFRDVRERKHALVSGVLQVGSSDMLGGGNGGMRQGGNGGMKQGGIGNGGMGGQGMGQGGMSKQIVAWNKGEFAPENVFCRTVDTGRLIPLDRTWTTHVYHHQSIQERKRPIMPVVFTMLPELMLLRGMHDSGCDEIFIIVTDLKRQEMDDVTEYFKLVCRHSFGGRPCKPSIERRIQYEHMRLSHTLVRQRRTPCFPQIDLTLRAILYEKRPRFLILFSSQTASYSQIFFTHPSYVPDEDIFYDYPTGCLNPCCTDDCEIIRFPRRGLATASVLEVRVGGKSGSGGGSGTGRSGVGRGGAGRGRKVKRKMMCNWIDCDVAFWEEGMGAGGGGSGSGSSEGSEVSVGGGEAGRVPGQMCSKCKLVRYCSPEHQRKDWDEHRRVCAKPVV
ncbi:hypothetical protein Hypma_016378 [Hypsizygus marmoreus]|uniref:MYND-type domain-containing protein n=1 Tax=Hypsizygus marmoreus TaxID=39966 RepID=A0A369J5R1_HYPMA|nr:hypothetical protein Hypma_016378 [Hypsizygus marmoreus]